MPATSHITLYHHPFTRAANVVWMLEELGLPYTLEYVDITQHEQSSAEFRQRNPMGKLPTLVDGDVTLTESAAIGMYLADRYGYGVLAPEVNAPERAAYLRYSLFAPSVIEPCCYARLAKWDYKPSSAGWGSYDNMLTAIEEAIGAGPWLLGEQFSMADIIFGGTVRFMLQFKMLEARPSFVAYVERLNARPASIAAASKNHAVAQQHKLGG